jgi:hypothetical protein
MLTPEQLGQSEYEALRATIRDRGTMRMYLVLGGLFGWAALATALVLVDVPRRAAAAYLQGVVILAPLLVLAATLEINFFVHTAVERIGRYLQVFYEEANGSPGWETTAMNYGSKFPGLDPLFAVIFSLGAAINFLSSLALAAPGLGWMAISLIAHLIFGYRIVTLRRQAAAQRALDLDRFRSLVSK